MCSDFLGVLPTVGQAGWDEVREVDFPNFLREVNEGVCFVEGILTLILNGSLRRCI